MWFNFENIKIGFILIEIPSSWIWTKYQAKNNPYIEKLNSVIRMLETKLSFKENILNSIFKKFDWGGGLRIQ
jgi:hypothetical protein